MVELPPRAVPNYVAENPHFGFLLNEGVSFFDKARVGIVPSGLLPTSENGEHAPVGDEERRMKTLIRTSRKSSGMCGTRENRTKTRKRTRNRRTKWDAYIKPEGSLPRHSYATHRSSI